MSMSREELMEFARRYTERGAAASPRGSQSTTRREGH
jgi:hypothetical protein